MSKVSFDLPANLSESLSELRKSAGPKQSDVAKKMGVDTSRVSRIETGEVTPTESEVLSYCNAVGTSESNNYFNFLKQDWEILRKPLYNHPERDSLYLAEYSLQLLNLFREDEEHPHCFAGRHRARVAGQQGREPGGGPADPALRLNRRARCADLHSFGAPLGKSPSALSRISARRRQCGPLQSCHGRRGDSLDGARTTGGRCRMRRTVRPFASLSTWMP